MIIIKSVVKMSADDILKYFFLLFPEKKVWHFMQIVFFGIFMKYQSQFSGKKKEKEKKKISLLPAEFTRRVFKVKGIFSFLQISLYKRV